MSKEKTSIIFTGDIGFDRYMKGQWNDSSLLSGEVLDFFSSADHTAANVEGALIDAVDDGSRGVFFHSMSPEVIKVLNKIGADIWCIGNNHTMDAGAEGLTSTRSYAAANNCRTIGAGNDINEASEPIYIDEAGGIGMFGVAYLSECVPATEDAPGIFPWNDMERIAARIREIKARCRWCVVVSHGGEEFAALPNPYTRNRYLKFLELGADVVVAHHPHVVENYELFDNGKAIFYSLGNFIFDTDYQRAHPYTDAGVLLKLIFTKDKLDFEAMGIRIVRGEEHIAAAPLPAVFTDISSDEYAILSPLNAKAFMLEMERCLPFIDKERFANASDKELKDYFCSPETDGYYKHEHMDLGMILKLSDMAETGMWKHSGLEDVKSYILGQLD